MASSLIDEEWALLETLLPANWKSLARQMGALRRARTVRSARDLLRLILLHSAGGLSLRQTVVRARVAGLPEISDVALLKRLRASEPWLRVLTEKLLPLRSRYRLRWCARLARRRIRVVDGTTILEPGATGTTWRVHYTLLLPSLACDFFEVTDPKGGESFKRIPIEAGDILLGDRGYCHREGVAHVVDGEGDVLVRLNLTNFPLLDETGGPLDILSALRTLRGLRPAEWAVLFQVGEKRYRARLCAVRKTKAAAERSKQKLIRHARDKGKTLSPEVLEAAEYVFVLTTIPTSELECWQVLEFYRVRWQVELAFKRLKSLLGIGHVPKYDPVSARAWIQAKLLTALLIERLMEKARFFSPWGFELSSTKHLA